MANKSFGVNDLSVSGNSSLNFTQSGTGAVTRTVDSKLKDVVSVKDFGAVGDGVTDDTAAIQAAVDASRNVYIPYGNYKISTAINLSNSYSCLIGDARKPFLVIDPDNGPAVKITAPASSINEFPYVENLILWCNGKPSFSATPDATNCGLSIDGSTSSVAASVQRAAVKNCRIIGFSCGINLKRHVNTLLERIFIEQHTAWTGTYTSSNLLVGVNFDLSPASAGGISPQASVELVQVLSNGGSAPANVTSIGFRAVGQDPRDIFFSRCEVANGDYGWYIEPTSNDYNIDIHIRRPIIDAVTKIGIAIINWGGYGALSIDGGYIIKNTSTSGAAIWIENSSGVAVNGVQLLGHTNNTSQDEGIRVLNSNSCAIANNLCINLNYGLSLETSTNCTVTGNVISANTGAFETAPNLNVGIRLFSTSTKNTISSNIIKGASATYKYSDGIYIESGSSSNFFTANYIDSTTVTTLYNILENNNFINTYDTIQANELYLKSLNAQLNLQGNDDNYPILFRDGSGTVIAKINSSGDYSTGAP